MSRKRKDIKKKVVLLVIRKVIKNINMIIEKKILLVTQMMMNHLQRKKSMDQNTRVIKKTENLSITDTNRPKENIVAITQILKMKIMREQHILKIINIIDHQNTMLMKVKMKVQQRLRRVRATKRNQPKGNMKIVMKMKNIIL